jgi:hypothetical protein
VVQVVVVMVETTPRQVQQEQQIPEAEAEDRAITLLLAVFLVDLASSLLNTPLRYQRPQPKSRFLQAVPHGLLLLELLRLYIWLLVEAVVEVATLVQGVVQVASGLDQNFL